MKKKKLLTVEKAIEQLADCVVESIEIEREKEREPFEVYAHKMRQRVYEEIPDFRSRFVQGYETLLNELKK